MTALETSTMPALLSSDLQERARRYVAARRRSGEALLEAVAELAAARQQAKHGEWGVFLEAVGLDESAARSQIRIHELANADPAFAERIRTGFLTEATARELLSAPPDVRASILAAPEPPTQRQVKEAKREALPGLRPAPAPIPMEFRDPEPEPLPADFAEWQERVAAFGQGYRLHHDGIEFVIERPERSPLYAAGWYKVESWVVENEHAQRQVARAPETTKGDQPPADCVELAAALGILIERSHGPEGGWIARWPDEQADTMIGMLDEELYEWLKWTAPHTLANRRAHGIGQQHTLPAPTQPAVAFKPPTWLTTSTTISLNAQGDKAAELCAKAGSTYSAHLFRIAGYPRAFPVVADIDCDLVDIEQSIVERNTQLVTARLKELEARLQDSADILPDSCYESFAMRIANAKAALQ